MRKVKAILCLLLLVPLGLWAQVITITGTVASESDNQPLPGVNVVIKGTSTGVITDLEGKYSINVASPDAVLEFSAIGYLTERNEVSGQSVIDIKLVEDIMDLEEVVVVGYGVKNKETLSGSITTIRTDEIKKSKSENLINMLQGKVSGLLIRQKSGAPGDFSNLISVRGFGDPLYIIDGVPRDGSSYFAQLNSDDIESISVLKDAAASIYGMNAANGVIIVTTKRGHVGKPAVSYSTFYSLKEPTGIPQTVDAYTYRVLRNEMDINAQLNPTYNAETLEKYRLGEPGYTDTDWLGLTMKDFTYSLKHNLSVSGGTEKTKYFTSFEYNDDNGLLKSNIQDYERINFRGGIETKITDNLTLDFNTSLRHTYTKGPQNDYIWAYKYMVVNDRGIGAYTLENPDHLTVPQPDGINPVGRLSEEISGYDKVTELRNYNTLKLTYELPFLKGLKIIGLTAYDSRQADRRNLQKAVDLYDYYTDSYVKTDRTNQFQNWYTLYNRLHAMGQIDYNKKIGEHTIGASTIAEFRSIEEGQTYASRLYEDIYTHDVINQGTPTTATNSGYRNYQKFAAYIGRLNYDFAGKYLFEGVVRYDGSYRYAPENRWALFPSASIAWRISEESFFADNLSFVNSLKLRFSYGESGFDAGSAFRYVPAYSSTTGYVLSPESLTVGYAPPSGLIDDKLSWVTTLTSNLGVDFALWNGLIGGAVDVFQRVDDGLLASRVQSVPNIFGATFPLENINSARTRGLDLEITHRNKVGNDFIYSVAVNATFSRYMDLHVERAEFNDSWDKWRNGQEERYNNFVWLFETDGRFESVEEAETSVLYTPQNHFGNSRLLPGTYKMKDLNGDGIINDADMSSNNWNYAGSRSSMNNLNPPLQFGFATSIEYKNFDLNLLFQGASLYSKRYHADDIYGYGRYPSVHEQYLDRWHTTDPTADPYDPKTQWESGYYGPLRKNFSGTRDLANSDFWYVPATYLRLKNLEIGYNFPKTVLSKFGFNQFRIFFNGTNLATFTNDRLKEIDPETWEGPYSASLTYPLLRAYNFGVNLKF
ncbi:MAG: TonB-dependent receptor [Bacteroidales bacterium]|nr:TonB-dependent receptor [Bacteroidales bacterium]MCF8405359.1 TonB-dependent receptor [Bacteroidales bacterium]